MLQNLNDQQSHITKTGSGTHPDKILNLIDHTERKYGQNHRTEGNADEKLIHGMPAATGVAVGYALVVETPEDLQRINPDTILICPRMSPVYSIAFQTVRGIISEHGGICSTAATLAREKGLPAVTGVKSARRIISDGDLIRMDGSNGSVQILNGRR